VPRGAPEEALHTRQREDIEDWAAFGSGILAAGGSGQQERALTTCNGKSSLF
jgi:hypothetical protein